MVPFTGLPSVEPGWMFPLAELHSVKTEGKDLSNDITSAWTDEKDASIDSPTLASAFHRAAAGPLGQ
jgi:hypothetical protein